MRMRIKLLNNITILVMGQQRKQFDMIDVVIVNQCSTINQTANNDNSKGWSSIGLLSLRLYRCHRQHNIIQFNLVSVSDMWAGDTAPPHLTISRQTRAVNLILVFCWASSTNGGPTLSQHWVNDLCFLTCNANWLLGWPSQSYRGLHVCGVENQFPPL